MRALILLLELVAKCRVASSSVSPGSEEGRGCGLGELASLPVTPGAEAASVLEIPGVEAEGTVAQPCSVRFEGAERT